MTKRGVALRTRARVVTALVAVVALLSMPSLAAAAAWPQDGYDGGHSSFNRREDALTPAGVDELQLAWRRTIAPATHGYEQFTRVTVVRGGRVFAAWHEDRGSRLVAFDDEGSRLWGSRHPFAYAVFAASGPDVVFAQVGSRVIARDGETGTKLWAVEDVRVSAALPSGSTLFVEFWDGARSVGAISGLDGSVIWRRELDYRRPPIVVGSSAFVTTRRPGRGSLHALDTATGETRWRRAIPPRSDALMAVDGRVFVNAESKGRSEVIAFDMAGGKRWTRSWPARSGLGVWVGAAGDGALFAMRTRCVTGCEGDAIGEYRGIVLALDVRTGRTLWALRGGYGTGDPLWSPDAVVRGVVFAHRVKFGGAQIAALGMGDGRVLWSRSFGARTIGRVSAVADGRVFAGTASGYRAHPNAGGRVYVFELPERRVR